MKAGFLLYLLSGLLLATTVRAADTFDEAMERAALEYAKRLRTASDELTRTRERIAGEKAPLLKTMRAAEDRIIAAEQEITRLDSHLRQAAEGLQQFDASCDSFIPALVEQSGLSNSRVHQSLPPGEESVNPLRVDLQCLHPVRQTKITLALADGEVHADVLRRK